MRLLQERLRKSSQITNSIDNILNTFEQRLLRLQDAILPVYNETENLQKTQQSNTYVLLFYCLKYRIFDFRCRAHVATVK